MQVWGRLFIIGHLFLLSFLQICQRFPNQSIAKICIEASYEAHFQKFTFQTLKFLYYLLKQKVCIKLAVNPSNNKIVPCF